MLFLAVFLPAIQGNEFEPLKILSCYYGFNDCMSMSTTDSWNYDIQRELGCPVNEGKKGLFGLIPGQTSRTRGRWMTRFTCGNLFGEDMGKNLDAMPISFNYPMVNDMDPKYFEITRNDGAKAKPDCAVFAPAGEDDERKTVVLMGHWGDGHKLTKWPVKVEIKGKLLFNVNGIIENGEGLVYDNEARMRWDVPLVLIDAVLMDFHEDSGNNGCAQQVGGDSKYHVKISLCGGGTMDGITVFEAGRKDVFELLDKNGNVMTKGYKGMAGLGDLDNFYDLCLGSDFDIENLAEVKATCDPDRGTLILPPKGDYPCKPHSMKVDKSRMTKEWQNLCKCDFDVNYESACDPNKLLHEDNFCDVPRSTKCKDRRFRWGSMNSRDACKFVGNWEKQESETLDFQTTFDNITSFDVAIYTLAAVGVLTLFYIGFSRCHSSSDFKDIPNEDTPLYVEA